MSRAGILGGTFDPVHNGHLFLGQQVKHAFALDEIIFLPLHLPPHKQKPQQSGQVRLELLQKAIQDQPGFSVSTIELKRKGLTYTIDTLRELQAQKKEYYYIIGSDTLLDMHKWREFETVLTLCTFVCIIRPGAENISHIIEEYQKNYDTKILTLEVTAPDISSTEIRQRVREGKDISKLVPETICSDVKKYYS